VGTVNVGSRAPAGPSFIWRCVRGPTATNGRRPRSGCDLDRADPEIRSRSGDPAAGEITSLTVSIYHCHALSTDYSNLRVSFF
jgi:hypothetical protein